MDKYKFKDIKTQEPFEIDSYGPDDIIEMQWDKLHDAYKGALQRNSSKVLIKVTKKIWKSFMKMAIHDIVENNDHLKLSGCRLFIADNNKRKNKNYLPFYKLTLRMNRNLFIDTKRLSYMVRFTDRRMEMVIKKKKLEGHIYEAI